MTERSYELKPVDIAEIAVTLRLAAPKWAALAESKTTALTPGASEVYARFSERCTNLADMFMRSSHVVVTMPVPDTQDEQEYDKRVRQSRETDPWNEPPF